MRKFLMIAGAVCALALFTASAEANHGCRPGFGGGGYGHGFGGGGHHRSFNSGYRGHNQFYRGGIYVAPRRTQSFYGGRGRNFYGPGIHVQGRGFRGSFRF